MSRTKKGKKPVGYDFWSKRASSKCNDGFGPDTKRRTHKIERIEAKTECRGAVERERAEYEAHNEYLANKRKEER